MSLNWQILSKNAEVKRSQNAASAGRVDASAVTSGAVGSVQLVLVSWPWRTSVLRNGRERPESGRGPRSLRVDCASARSPQSGERAAPEQPRRQ